MTKDTAEYLVRDWGLVAVFGGTVLDHTGLPVPLIVGIALAGHGLINPWGVMVAAFIACVVSDVLAYLIGRYWLRSVFGFPFIGRRVEKVCNIVATSPHLAVFIGRFIPAIGKYAPVAVASTGTRLLPLVPAILAGSAVYVGVFSLAAWAGWEAFTETTWQSIAILSFSAMSIVALTFVTRKALKKDQSPVEAHDE